MACEYECNTFGASYHSSEMMLKWHRYMVECYENAPDNKLFIMVVNRKNNGYESNIKGFNTYAPLDNLDDFTITSPSRLHFLNKMKANNRVICLLSTPYGDRCFSFTKAEDE